MGRGCVQKRRRSHSSFFRRVQSPAVRSDGGGWAGSTWPGGSQQDTGNRPPPWPSPVSQRRGRGRAGGRSPRGPRCAARALRLAVVGGGHLELGLCHSQASAERAWPWAASSCPLACHQGHPAHLPLRPSLLTSLPFHYANDLPVGPLGTATRGRLTNRHGPCPWARADSPLIPSLQRTWQTWGTRHPHLSWPHSPQREGLVDMQLASDPAGWGAVRRASWLTSPQILTRRVSRGHDADRRPPARPPKPGVKSEGPSSRLFSTKGK